MPALCTTAAAARNQLPPGGLWLTSQLSSEAASKRARGAGKAASRLGACAATACTTATETAGPTAHATPAHEEGWGWFEEVLACVRASRRSQRHE